MNKKILLSSCFIFLLNFPTISYSSEIKSYSQPSSSCEFQETAEISIRFDLIIDEAVQADIEVKKISSEIEMIAKQEGIEVITLKSMNFNINSQRQNQGNYFQLNGNIRYQITTYSQALELVDKLKNSGYQVSLSVNKYSKNC